MNFLRSNLIWLVIFGALCFLIAVCGGSILRPWLLPGAILRWFRGLSRVRVGFVIGSAACFSVALVVAYAVAVGSPGGEDTVVEGNDDDSSSDTPHGLVEVLQAPWDAFSERSNWPVAVAMAEVSLAAYLPPVEAELKFDELGYEKVSVISDGSQLGYVLAAKDSIVIVFRGTDDPGDWIVNLDTRGSQTRNGIVHRGFFEAYQKLASQINNLLSENPPAHIWVTGHSLGGALAVMCAYDLGEQHKKSIDGLITFGQPMVARLPLTAKIEELMPSRYVHFVNERDIVARIPPSYAHCGELVHYVGGQVRRSRRERLYGAADPQEMEITLPPPDDSVEPISEGEFAALKREIRKEQAQPDFGPNGEMLYKGSSPFIQDHDMETYLERLR